MNKEERALAVALIDYFDTINTTETRLAIVIGEGTLVFKISVSTLEDSPTGQVEQPSEPS